MALGILDLLLGFRVCLGNHSAGDLTLGDVAVDGSQASTVLTSPVDGS